MSRLILILLTLIFSVLFLFYDTRAEIGFPFSDQILTVDTYMYFLFEHLTVLILSVVMLSMATEYRYAFKVFLAIQIIDTVDYCLTYGEPWGFLPVSWNVIKVLLFSSIVGYELRKTIWKNLHRHSGNT